MLDLEVFVVEGGSPVADSLGYAPADLRLFSILVAR